MKLKRTLFKTLVKLNNFLLPGYYKLDPARLTSYQKLLTGYRYWVLRNSLS